MDPRPERIKKEPIATPPITGPIPRLIDGPTIAIQSTVHPIQRRKEMPKAGQNDRGRLRMAECKSCAGINPMKIKMIPANMRKLSEWQ